MQKQYCMSVVESSECNVTMCQDFADKQNVQYWVKELARMIVWKHNYKSSDAFPIARLRHSQTMFMTHFLCLCVTQQCVKNMLMITEKVWITQDICKTYKVSHQILQIYLSLNYFAVLRYDWFESHQILMNGFFVTTTFTAPYIQHLWRKVISNALKCLLIDYTAASQPGGKKCTFSLCVSLIGCHMTRF